MKCRVYLKIAKGKKGVIVAVSTKPSFFALETGSVYSRRSVPTVQVAFDLVIPDSEFDAARILLQAQVKSAVPCVQVRQVKNEEVKDDTGVQVLSEEDAHVGGV